MASENAKAVAYEMLEKVQKGEKVIKKDLIKNHGYTKSMSEHPYKVINTDSFQSVVTPFVQSYEKELREIIEAMGLKDKNSEEYSTLVNAAEKIQKLVELLSGRATERTEKPLTEDQLNELFNRRSKETLPTG